MKIKTTLFFVLVCFVFNSCAIFEYQKEYVAKRKAQEATKNRKLLYTAKINSISGKEEISNKRCIIVSSDKNISPNDLQFLEFSEYVKRALANDDYIFISDPSKADVAIAIGYGVGNPETRTHTYSMPVFGKTGLSSTTTKYDWYSNEAKTQLNYNYGIYTKDVNVSVTTYKKYVTVEALDLKYFKKNKKVKQLWKTMVYNIDANDDLRVHFPFLIAAANIYLGKDTERTIDNQIYDDDEIASSIINGEEETE